MPQQISEKVSRGRNIYVKTEALRRIKDYGDQRGLSDVDALYEMIMMFDPSLKYSPPDLGIDRSDIANLKRQHILLTSILERSLLELLETSGQIRHMGQKVTGINEAGLLERQRFQSLFEQLKLIESEGNHE